ncbi:MAG TPA: c-type cytochrome [Candidatus Tectomicrobia bacterium]
MFLLLTIDTIRRVPAQTKQQNLTEQVVHGKHLWERNNCMGCHTLLGEGAYYAPELSGEQLLAGGVAVAQVVPWWSAFLAGLLFLTLGWTSGGPLSGVRMVALAWEIATDNLSSMA